MTAIARKLAYEVLVEVYDGKKYTNLSLQQAYRKGKLDERDKALCTEVVYGTVQRQRSVDALLQLYCHRSLSDLDVRVLSILRMSIYQLGFLDRIPGYAVLNDAVDLCKAKVPKAAGFVNGVLRSFTRDKRAVAARLNEIAENCGSWAESMGVLHSYPTWLVVSLEHTYGQDRTVEIMTSCNRPSNLSVRVNALQATRDTVLAEIAMEFGDVAEPSNVSPEAIRFLRGIEVENWNGYKEGRVSVQDEGAMLIAHLLRPREHPHVLDLCAGLGTKTTQIAELQGDEGKVDGCDIHQHKLRKLRDAGNRLGLNSIQPMLADARFLPSRADKRGTYDAVLLDAPCSGLGVLRHRPDIRWNRVEADIASLVELQKELLQAAVEMVRPGGVIVYATCTILDEENHQVVDAVVKSSGGLVEWDDISNDLPETVLDKVQDVRCGCLLTPELFGTDGFYMARLRRKS
jgi:16S rRNA (cytosine967-C5)-methyltransferase